MFRAIFATSAREAQPCRKHRVRNSSCSGDKACKLPWPSRIQTVHHFVVRCICDLFSSFNRNKKKKHRNTDNIQDCIQIPY